MAEDKERNGHHFGCVFCAGGCCHQFHGMLGWRDTMKMQGRESNTWPARRRLCPTSIFHLGPHLEVALIAHHSWAAVTDRLGFVHHKIFLSEAVRFPSGSPCWDGQYCLWRDAFQMHTNKVPLKGLIFSGILFVTFGLPVIYLFCIPPPIFQVISGASIPRVFFPLCISVSP